MKVEDLIITDYERPVDPVRQAHPAHEATLAAHRSRIIFALVAALEAFVASVAWTLGGFPIVTVAFVLGFAVIGWSVGRSHDRRRGR